MSVQLSFFPALYRIRKRGLIVLLSHIISAKAAKGKRHSFQNTFFLLLNINENIEGKESRTNTPCLYF